MPLGDLTAPAPKLYVAVATGKNGGVDLRSAANSGLKETFDAAAEWGHTHIRGTPSCKKVIVLAVIGELSVEEREPPPITFKPIGPLRHPELEMPRPNGPERLAQQAREDLDNRNDQSAYLKKKDRF